MRSIIRFRHLFGPADGRRRLRRARPSAAAAVAVLVGWGVLAGASAYAQSPSTFGAAAPVPPASIFGFEVEGAWQLSTTSPTASPSLSTVRTQGASALSVANPNNGAKLTSRTIASTAPQLATLYVPGALLAVDLRFPGTRQFTNGGSLRLSVTSPSRGLNKAPLGKVDLGNLRVGTYQTISFAFTDQARKALMGSAFNDLTFELALTSQVAGEYLFDNLRVRSVRGVTATQDTTVPAGYGGSVDFDLDLGVGNEAPLLTTAATVPGSAEQLFDVGPVQVPDRFHVKTGTADAGTSMQLDLGYSPALVTTSCVYLPDPLDAKQRSYVVSSCTGGLRPGDIMSASWARLQLLNGAAPTRIRAQLARLPLGDQMGSGLIPPMPTFWGEEDGCVLDLSAEGTQSQSCADVLAESSAIVDQYFAAATQRNPAAGWIVSPVPEFAKRHGNGEPDGAAAVAAPFAGGRLAQAPLSDAQPIHYSDSGHLNEGGLFDAYWDFDANLDYHNTPGTDRTTTHFDAQFGTHGVVFGYQATALSASVTAQTDTGETTPQQIPGSAHADARLYVFGVEYPQGGVSFDGDLSYYKPLFAPPPLELARLQYWVFKLSAGLRAEAGLRVTGSLTGSGIDASIIPEGSVQGYVFGGIDIFIVSGGVQANVDLIRVQTPVTAKVGWTFDPSLANCSASLDGSLDADLTFSSLGGEVALVASTGFCPVCDTYALKLFTWGPIVEHTSELIHQPLGSAVVPLPTQLCPGNAATVTIQAPSSAFTTIYGAKTYPLKGLAFSNNAGPGFGQEIDCSNFSWSTNAPDTITGSGCNANIVFANTPHQSTIKLDVSRAFADTFGRPVSESGGTTTNVSVTTLAPGVTISYVLDVDQNAAVPYRPLKVLSPPPPGGYILTADYLSLPGVDPGDIQYRWTVLHKGVTTDITCSLSNLDSCVPDGLSFSLKKVYWVPQDLNDGFGYTVTFSAISKATGLPVDADSFDALFNAVN